MGNIISD